MRDKTGIQDRYSVIYWALVDTMPQTDKGSSR